MKLHVALKRRPHGSMFHALSLNGPDQLDIRFTGSRNLNGRMAESSSGTTTPKGRSDGSDLGDSYGSGCPVGYAYGGDSEGQTECAPDGEDGDGIGHGEGTAEGRGDDDGCGVGFPGYEWELYRFNKPEKGKRFYG